MTMELMWLLSQKKLMQSLLTCKSFIYSNICGDKPANERITTNLTASEWELVDEIVEVFSQPFAVMKQMQSKHFTLSDFYGAWLRIEMWLEKT